MSAIQEIAIRLVEERAKKGLTQNDIAKKTGKSKRQYINYENGTSEMTVTFLSKLDELDIDILYIITGKANLQNTEEKANITNNNIQAPLTNSVIAGTGSTVNNINTTKHVTRTKAEVKPDETHINDEQKAHLQRLVKEIVELEQKYRTKKSAKSFGAVWGSLNKKLKVSSYHLIPKEKFETARIHLQKWIGRLNSTKTASKTNSSNVRKKRYAYIHTNIKLLDIEDWYRKYLMEKFNVESSKDLSDDELHKAYHAVAYRVRKAKNS